MSRRVLISIGLVVVVALVAAGVPLGLTYLHKKAEREQRITATGFATAWVKGTLASESFTNEAGADVAKAVATATAGLTSASKDAPSSVQVTGITTGSDKATASASLKVTWTLAGDRTWSYRSTLPMKKASGAWLVSYEPSIIHPDLQTGGKLVATVEPGNRGDIIGANNQTLVTEGSVVVVGLAPSRTTDIGSSVQQIVSALKPVVSIDAAGLTTRAKAASKDAFVQVVTLREAAYDSVRSVLQPIPGAVFQRTSQSLTTSPGFARTILGSVGEATADIVKNSNGRVLAGETTGVSGLQLSQDAVLAGKPGLTVTLQPAKTSASTTGTGTTATKTLFSDDPVNGQDLHITLDKKIQIAAQNAIAKVKDGKNAGIVVLRASTGDVLAVANNPAGGYNRALVGQYPPGSTFKIVTSMALLGAGYTIDTPVPCPSSVTVDGRKFQNAENEVLGTVPFHHDFADSCNTAFVGSAGKITQKQLSDTATKLGYGTQNNLGLTAFTGSVPATSTATDHAASMIGQGRILASPLTVAGTAAAIDSGTYYPPRLVLNGASPADGSDTATPTVTDTSSSSSSDYTEPAPTGGVTLPADRVAALRTMMREVVTSGTGTPLKSAAGGPVSGKTGTAEYGGGTDPKTHAWFTGFQGDIAFAVVVEDGGFGAQTAAPIARDLLNQLAS